MHDRGGLRVVALQLALEGEARAHLGDGGLERFDEVDGTRRRGGRLDEIEGGADRGLEGAELAAQLVDERALLARFGEAPAQQTGQHPEARERVADLVGEARRHLAQRREPLAEPLALVDALEGLEIAEEQRSAAQHPALPDGGEGEADGARRLRAAGQHQLGPARRLAPFEGGEQQLRHDGLGPEHLLAGPAQQLGPRSDAEDPARRRVQHAEPPRGVDRRHARAQRVEQPDREGVARSVHAARIGDPAAPAERPRGAGYSACASWARSR